MADRLGATNNVANNKQPRVVSITTKLSINEANESTSDTSASTASSSSSCSAVTSAPKSLAEQTSSVVDMVLSVFVKCCGGF